MCPVVDHSSFNTFSAGRLIEPRAISIISKGYDMTSVLSIDWLLISAALYMWRLLSEELLEKPTIESKIVNTTYYLWLNAKLIIIIVCE